MSAPKLFISYSWSNPEHEEFVLRLATALMEDGVDVKLDKWDLKEGYDAYKFMEQMVTDPEIRKVAVISDRIYAEKADGRHGGVGTETQIISKEVYTQTEQGKFVAVVTEKDEHGKPYLPTYFKPLIYIDLSDNTTYGDNYDRLLRWIFDKPLYVKPEIGKPPAYLNDNASIQLGTTANYTRALDALKNHKPYALAALKDYLSSLSENLDRFRISGANTDFDEEVVKNIELFLPYRNEYIQLLNVLVEHEEEEYRQAIHRFFEQLLPYLEQPRTEGTFRDWDIDNFKFIVHELFLYTIAIALKKEAFSYVTTLLTEHYYLPYDSGYSIHSDGTMTHFGIIRQFLGSLEHRNKRLNLQRTSVHADLLKERGQSSGLKFEYLMQADFILFLNCEINDFSTWWPYTLIYIGYHHRPFEIFARSQSKKYFDQIKKFLNITELKDLENLLLAYQNRSRKLPTGSHGTMFDPAVLTGFKHLCSAP